MRACILLLLGPVLAVAAPPNLDGGWSFRERYCIAVNGERRCGRGVDEFLFSGSVAYYRLDANSDWGEVGTVTTNRRHMVLRVSRQGVGRLIRHLMGADVTDMLHNFSIVFTGIAHPERITRGHQRLSLDLKIGGTVYRVRSSGHFTARRIPEPSRVRPATRGSTSSWRPEPAASGPLSMLAEIAGAATGAR